MTASIDDLAPVTSPQSGPRLHLEAAGHVLSIVDESGRMHRWRLSPQQFGRLAGDLAVAIADGVCEQMGYRLCRVP